MLSHSFILIDPHPPPLFPPPNRHDINTEMAPVLYERFLWVKAGLDFALNVILLAGCLVRGTALQTPAAAAALGALFQLEEVANLWLMFRMGQLPFQFLVLKDDASEVDVFYMKTLRGGLALGLLFTVPVLAGKIRNPAGSPRPLRISSINHLPPPNHPIRIPSQPACAATTGSSSGSATTRPRCAPCIFVYCMFIYTLNPMNPPPKPNLDQNQKSPTPPPSIHPTPTNHPTSQFYAFYWFALCISLLCAATFVRVSRVAEHRRRKALRHVRYGDYYTRMTVEIAVALFFDTAIWLLPYFLRVASWASAADGRRPGWRARWARLLDVYAIGYRGAVDAAVYLPKDGLVAGAYVSCVWGVAK